MLALVCFAGSASAMSSSTTSAKVKEKFTFKAGKLKAAVVTPSQTFGVGDHELYTTSNKTSFTLVLAEGEGGEKITGESEIILDVFRTDFPDAGIFFDALLKADLKIKLGVKGKAKITAEIPDLVKSKAVKAVTLSLKWNETTLSGTLSTKETTGMLGQTFTSSIPGPIFFANTGPAIAIAFDPLTSQRLNIPAVPAGTWRCRMTLFNAGAQNFTDVIVEGSYSGKGKSKDTTKIETFDDGSMDVIKSGSISISGEASTVVVP